MMENATRSSSIKNIQKQNLDPKKFKKKGENLDAILELKSQVITLNTNVRNI
jgi:hypothetical protein